jgi:predicted ester cyclase
MQGWKQAMPDVRGKVTTAFAAGNRAVLEVTYEGTHTGPFKGPSGNVPPTGRRQVTPAAWILEFDGGKIKESHQYFDMLSLLQQLGALPQLEAAARR